MDQLIKALMVVLGTLSDEEIVFLYEDFQKQIADEPAKVFLQKLRILEKLYRKNEALDPFTSAEAKHLMAWVKEQKEKESSKP